jgi:hypothetical protein
LKIGVEVQAKAGVTEIRFQVTQCLFAAVVEVALTIFQGSGDTAVHFEYLHWFFEVQAKMEKLHLKQ